MNLNKLPYYLSFVIGIYAYLIYQLIYFVSFGEFYGICFGCNVYESNPVLSQILDHFTPYFIGVGSAFIALFFVKNFDLNKKAVLVLYTLAILLSYQFLGLASYFGYVVIFVSFLFSFMILFIVEKSWKGEI